MNFVFKGRPSEVYLIDALVARQKVDHERLGKFLHVTEEHFLSLREELILKVRLSEVKQSCPAFTSVQTDSLRVGLLHPQSGDVTRL